MNTSRILLITISLVFVYLPSLEAQADTVVTTYVTKVQKERKSTRFTLTEWLKIKERMKMMDLWLAIFSSPKKDVFSPELNLHHGMMNGSLNLTDAAGNEEIGAISGTQSRVQMWLTNIFTASTGVRTLNLDFGMEGYGRKSGSFDPAQNTAAMTAVTNSSLDLGRSQTTQYYTANFRIFGKNIQDSSLVLKYGQFNSENTLAEWGSEEERKLFKGRTIGADMNLYFTSWLGLEGNYLQFGDQAEALKDDGFIGSYYDYNAFIEISLLRFSMGRYTEAWTYQNDGNAIEAKEEGVVGGLKLLF